MEREDAKDLTLSVLVVVVLALVADCIWLHVKCARQSRALQAVIEQLSHPPQSSHSFVDTAKQAFGNVKAAAEKGYDAAKSELRK